MFLPISWFYAIIFLISAQKFCPKWGVTECQNGTETKQFEIGWWNERTSKGFISEPFWLLEMLHPILETSETVNFQPIYSWDIGVWRHQG